MEEPFIEKCLKCNTPCDCKENEHQKMIDKGYNHALYLCENCAVGMSEEQMHYIFNRVLRRRIK